MNTYIEPFVGMGALYLDLRGRGFRGPVTLADSHPQVASFWRQLHTDAAPLVAAAERLTNEPATADRFYNALDEHPDNEAELVAWFLWLTNFSYGNHPNVYRGGWSHHHGTKLTSAAKWNKTFPWAACVDRLRSVARVVEGMPTTVVTDAAVALARATSDSYVYADPPYHRQRRYSGSDEAVTYVDLIASALGTIVLSESPIIAERLSGWRREDGTITARMSGGDGATPGGRIESIYIRENNT
jgi:site-specific DNA-adenine methylase